MKTNLPIELVLITVISWIQRCCPCPEDNINAIMNCLSAVAMANRTDQDVNLLSGKDVRHMENHCTTGGFSNTIECLEILFDSCQPYPDKLTVLHKFADISEINSTFWNFCQNIEVYNASSACISSQELVIQKCLNKSDDSSTHGKIHGICRTFLTIHDCSAYPVLNECGTIPGNLVSNFLRGITPPICVGYEHVQSLAVPSQQFRLSVVLVQLLVIVYMM